MLTPLIVALALPLGGPAIADALEGRFDNARQMAGETDPARPHLHVVHERFANPVIPGSLVYSQLHVGGPDGDIYRQRVYALEDAPGADGRLRMSVYTLAQPERLASAEARLANLQALSPGDLERSDPGCDFYWQASDTGYAGEIDDGTCRVVSSRSGRVLVITARFTIAPDLFTHGEAGHYSDDGIAAFAPPGGIPNIYDRIEHAPGQP